MTTTSFKRRGQGGAAANNTPNTNNRVSTPLSTNDYPSHPSNSASTASHRGPNGLASSHHPPNPSNIPGYSNSTGNSNGGLANGNVGHFNNGTVGDHINSVSESPDISSNQVLAGPGIVPHARSASVHSNTTNANGVGGGARSSNNANLNAADGEGADGGIGDAGDADGDNDDNRTYCYCDGVSYGEMIACDDENCEREWVCPLISVKFLI